MVSSNGHGANGAYGGRTRDRNRKDKILAAARQLFCERGFHAVGVDDIGAAAGITGPGVYRHFDGKDELLIAALNDAADQLWRSLDTQPGASPAETLESYLRSHIEFAVRNADLIALWYQERRHLPDDAQIEQRRKQRRYVERWVDVLLHARPELTDDEARVMVHASIGLIHSVVHYETMLDVDHLTRVLLRMDLAAFAA